MATRRKTTEPPYWLIGFEEICIACEQPLARAVARRCGACDGVVCAVCATVDEETFCSVACTPRRERKWQRARSGKA